MSVSPLGFPDFVARGAVFMSGTGVNAETILQQLAASSAPSWIPACIVTDRPNSSRSAELAERFDLPLVAHDIRAFYGQHGLKSQSLATAEGWRVRELWTEALRDRLRPFKIDFGVLAGFLALSNVTADFPCLNVHPGDLTVEVDGCRHLIGHHTLPIERAILLGLPSLRTSVIIAQPIADSSDMDSGPILGVSPEVPVLLKGQPVAELATIAKNRPSKRPRGGWNDALATLSDDHLSRLKMAGDLLVFPPVIDAFVAGCYGLDDQGGLCWRDTVATPWQPVRTVQFDADAQSTPVPR